MNIKLFFHKEEPCIARFHNGDYCIRKKRRFSTKYMYLDIVDIKTHADDINWRYFRKNSVSWVSRKSLTEVKMVFDNLLNGDIGESADALTEDEIQKEVFKEKLGGKHTNRDEFEKGY